MQTNPAVTAGRHQLVWRLEEWNFVRPVARGRSDRSDDPPPTNLVHFLRFTFFLVTNIEVVSLIHKRFPWLLLSLGRVSHETLQAVTPPRAFCCGNHSLQCAHCLIFNHSNRITVMASYRQGGIIFFTSRIASLLLVKMHLRQVVD